MFHKKIQCDPWQYFGVINYMVPDQFITFPHIMWRKYSIIISDFNGNAILGVSSSYIYWLKKDC
jgi:hypothetical protein